MEGIILNGTDVKFKVSILCDGFDQRKDDFVVIIRQSWGKACRLIRKSDMFTSKKGDFYFTMENVRSGSYSAETRVKIQDADFEDGTMTLVSRQYLMTVGSCQYKYGSELPDFSDGMTVVFERIWTASIDGTMYLADKNGKLVLDKNGHRIALSPTCKR